MHIYIYILYIYMYAQIHIRRRTLFPEMRAERQHCKFVKPAGISVHWRRAFSTLGFPLLKA